MDFERSLLLEKKEESQGRGEDHGSKVRMIGVATAAVVLVMIFDILNTEKMNVASASVEIDERSSSTKKYSVSDKEASKLTKVLYNRLLRLTEEDAIIFGHEADTVYGQSFFDHTGSTGSSDVYTAIGAYPILTGHNLEQLRLQEYEATATIIENWQSFGQFQQFMWTAPNPSLNLTGTERECSGHPSHELTIEGSEANSVWRQYLEELATLFKSLKTESDNEPIPTVLRLFHESTGWWYWWSQSCASDQDFIDAWQYTVNYLRNDLQVHNILLAYCPSKPGDVDMLDAAIRRYPGDKYVDIIGWDRYSHPIKYKSGLERDCDQLLPFVHEHSKLAVLGETGIMNGLEVLNDWPRNFSFVSDFADVLVGPNRNLNCSQIAYAHTWANYNDNRYWVPLQGQVTYDSFANMSNLDNVLFSSSRLWTEIIQSL